MIVPNQKVKVKWSNRNKTYYTNLNYIGFENGKEFLVRIEDLPLNSPATVEIICDFCGKHHFNQYRRKSHAKNHFCCRECQDKFLIGKPSWNNKKIIVNCSYCNKETERSEWELKYHKNLFCSKECADNFLREFGEGRPKVERFKLKCDQCGKEFERTQKEMDRSNTHFCCKECADEFQKGKIKEEYRNGHEVKCYNCGIEFYLPKYRINSQTRYFCSNECRKIWLQSEEFIAMMSSFEKPKVSRIQVNCFTCGKEFEILPSQLRSEKHFCSEKCWLTFLKEHNPNPKKDKIKVNCYTCGKEKWVHESIFQKNNYFFCSQKCYQEKRIKISDFKFTGTSIHLKIDDLLENMGIKYKNEESFGYYSVDIFLPEHLLGIEIMGDYWHGNPNKYKDVSELNKIQLKDISKDRRKNIFINKKFNTKILYLWEYDINERIKVCEELIKEFIDNAGNLKNYNSFNYEINNSNLFLKDNIVSTFQTVI